jgi:hypothetical protein
MQPDPLGTTVADTGTPQSWHLYNYVWNYPFALQIQRVWMSYSWATAFFNVSYDPETGRLSGASFGGCVNSGQGLTPVDLGSLAHLSGRNQAIDETRWAEFFRKGGRQRGLVKGKRWLLSRWVNLSGPKRQELNTLFYTTSEAAGLSPYSGGYGTSQMRHQQSRLRDLPR